MKSRRLSRLNVLCTFSYDAGMEITHQGETVRFEQPRARLLVRLDGRHYRVPWGRRSNEEGALPASPYVALPLLEAGLFDGFKQQLVPILADEYKTDDDRGYLVPDIVQPGQFIQGLMVQLTREKRVYVVGTAVKGQKGYYMCPRMMWTR